MQVDIFLIISAILAFIGFIIGFSPVKRKKYNTNVSRLYTSIQTYYYDDSVSEQVVNENRIGREIQIIAKFEDECIHTKNIIWAKLFDVKTGTLIKEYYRGYNGN